jgi:hypothetical protein
MHKFCDLERAVDAVVIQEECERSRHVMFYNSIPEIVFMWL